MSSNLNTQLSSKGQQKAKGQTQARPLSWPLLKEGQISFSRSSGLQQQMDIHAGLSSL